MRGNIVTKEVQREAISHLGSPPPVSELNSQPKSDLSLENIEPPKIALTADELDKLVRDIGVRLKEVQKLSNEQLVADSKAKVEQDLGSFPEKLSGPVSTVQIGHADIQKIFEKTGLPYHLVENLVSESLEKSNREKELQAKLREVREEKGLGADSTLEDVIISNEKKQISDLLDRLIEQCSYDNQLGLRGKIDAAIKGFQTETCFAQIKLGELESREVFLRHVKGSLSLAGLLNPLNWSELSPVIAGVVTPITFLQGVDPSFGASKYIAAAVMAYAAVGLATVFTFGADAGSEPNLREDIKSFGYGHAVRFRCSKNLFIDVPGYETLKKMVEFEGCKLRVELTYNSIDFYADIPKVK